MIQNSRLQILAPAAIVLALSIGACTGGAAPSPAVSPQPVASPVPSASVPVVPESPVATEAEGTVPQAVIDAAVADAAARAGVDPAAVTVLSAEAMTFPSGALGCPEPGMMYTDVLTPGYKVVVEAGGSPYDYRASERGEAVRWCEQPPFTG